MTEVRRRAKDETKAFLSAGTPAVRSWRSKWRSILWLVYVRRIRPSNIYQWIFILIYALICLVLLISWTRTQKPDATVKNLRHVESRYNDSTDISERAEAAQMLGNHFGSRQEHDQAYHWHRRALDLQKVSMDAKQQLQAELQLSKDLVLDLKFNSSLEILVKLARASTSLRNSERAAIRSALSGVYDCMGDHVAALQSFEEALELEPNSNIKTIRQHHLMISQVLSSPSITQSLDLDVLSQLKARSAKLWDRLSSSYKSRHQLPLLFIEDLHTRKWHDVDDEAFSTVGPVLRKSAFAIQRFHKELTAEYLHLVHQGVFRSSSECIHETRPGSWQKFDASANYHSGDALGCALISPVACALFRELKEVIHLPVIRVGYSVMGPNTHLRPHFGPSNAALKFHLGLIVPRKNGSSGAHCAALSVGSKERPWEEGELLFFDDSFRHEAWNNCSEERVVLQVVFKHPGVWTGSLSCLPYDCGPASAALFLTMWQMRRFAIPAIIICLVHQWIKQKCNSRSVTETKTE